MITLKNTLIINALSSGATGLGLVAFSSTVAQLFGVEQRSPFMSAGIFLVLFAIGVLMVSAGKPINDKAVKVIIALDVLWVIGSLILIAMAGSTISMIGLVAIIAVALWVAGMVILQRRGLQLR